MIGSTSEHAGNNQTGLPVPQVIFANWREALHGSGIVRHIQEARGAPSRSEIHSFSFAEIMPKARNR